MKAVNNENKVSKFDHEVFGTLRVIVIDEEQLFVGNEVASTLGYANSAEAINTHCKYISKVANSVLLGASDYKAGIASGHLHNDLIRKVNLIPEKDVYRLIMRSKLPQAELFSEWIMEEVLPTIRNSGGYVSDVDQIIESFYKNEQPHVKEVIRAGLNFQKDNQHKVAFFEDVAEVVNLQTITEVAKAFGVGRNKMFAELRDQKVLTKERLPYQTYIDQGYFEVKQTTKNGYVHNVTLVTGKGELYLHKKLTKSGFIGKE